MQSQEESTTGISLQFGETDGKHDRRVYASWRGRRIKLIDGTTVIITGQESRVAIREIAKGDAALQYAEATASLFRSYADYQAVLGIREQLDE